MMQTLIIKPAWKCIPLFGFLRNLSQLLQGFSNNNKNNKVKAQRELSPPGSLAGGGNGDLLRFLKGPVLSFPGSRGSVPGRREDSPPQPPVLCSPLSLQMVIQCHGLWVIRPRQGEAFNRSILLLEKEGEGHSFCQEP